MFSKTCNWKTRIIFSWAFCTVMDILLCSCSCLVHAYAHSLISVLLFVTLCTVFCQAPLSMGSPCKDTRMCCHFFLWGIFPTKRLNLRISVLLCYYITMLTMVVFFNTQLQYEMWHLINYVSFSVTIKITWYFSQFNIPFPCFDHLGNKIQWVIRCSFPDVQTSFISIKNSHSLISPSNLSESLWSVEKLSSS